MLGSPVFVKDRDFEDLCYILHITESLIFSHNTVKLMIYKLNSLFQSGSRFL